ncbi:MAG: molybdate ABC transporter permease subunit [Jatrophihabitans sp.]
MRPGQRVLRAPQRARLALESEQRRGVPAPFIPLAAVCVLFLGLPIIGLLVRAPWRTLLPTLREADALRAMRLSLECATSATVLALLIGVPTAWVLARARVPGISVLRAVVLLPLVLPPVAGGIALFAAFGRSGLLGQYLDRWFGITLPFSTVGVVIAETFVAMPFLIVTVEGALRGSDGGLEEAAATLGASRWTIMRKVTLSRLAPSLIAGSVLCWARALGEFGATIIFAGNNATHTRTAPILVSLGLDTSPQQAIALSLVLVLVSLVILVGLRDRWLRQGTAQ